MVLVLQLLSITIPTGRVFHVYLLVLLKITDHNFSNFFMTSKDDDNLETLKRRKIPIRSTDEELEVNTTEENIQMNPVNELESLYRQKVGCNDKQL